MFSPRWLFLYPGLVAMMVGVCGALAIVPGPLPFAPVRLDVAALAAACALVVIGLQSVLFAIFTSVYASNEGFLPASTKVGQLLKSWSLERGLAAGAALGFIGLVGVIADVLIWSDGFSGYDPNAPILRILLPSLTALIMSCQLVSAAFFISILGIRHTSREVTESIEIRVDSAIRQSSMMSESASPR
jgi:hypothetical protein